MAAFCAWLTAHGSSCLEFTAVVFGIVSVTLSVKQNIWSWPTALVNVGLYFLLFFEQGLYSDMGLQVVYFGLSLYGWYEWLYGGKDRSPLAVSTLPTQRWPAVAAVGVAMWLAFGTITSRLPGAAVPYLDAALVSGSLIAQWMMTRKLLENWTLWIILDVVYVALFISRGLYLTAVNYAVYLVLAAAGYLAWKRSLTLAPAPIA
ncbi:MAG TPA: nicotinamide riboside transporter PnuC [Gemmatimonadaceae bacterium]